MDKGIVEASVDAVCVSFVQRIGGGPRACAARSNVLGHTKNDLSVIDVGAERNFLVVGADLGRHLFAVSTLFAWTLARTLPYTMDWWKTAPVAFSRTPM